MGSRGVAFCACWLAALQAAAVAGAWPDEAPAAPARGVAFLEAAGFDATSIVPTPGDDNVIYRLIQRLIPEGDRGTPPPCDITSPGPDTANFPNSPLTLPKGRSYIEFDPGTFSLAGADGTPATWSSPFLLRTGLTDSCELRIFSQGPTVVGATRTDPGFDGFAPLAFDVKVHLWGDPERMWLPVVGVEAFLMTGLASRPFQVGVEPGLVLLVDHRLPGDWTLEWNVGCFGNGGDGIPDILSLPNLGVQWSLQKQLTRRLAAFYQGFYNTAGIPYFPADLVSGFGGQWAVTQRLMIYGSYNWSLDDRGSPSGGSSGFTYAF